MSVEALPRASRSVAVMVLLVLAAVLWHLMLPAGYYRNIAVYLEGPLPAVVGAAAGLWRHRDEPAPVRALAACLWAVVACAVVIALVGTLRFGPLQALAGLWALLRNGFRIPFAAMLSTSGGSTLYLFWAGIRTLLVWGALGYVALLLLRPETRGRLGSVAAGYGERRAFGRVQRQQAAEYRRLYLEAVKNGQTPPAPPPILTAPALGTNWGGHAQIAYWLLRIGLAVAGAIGLYAVFQERLVDSFAGVMLRGLLGG